MLKLIARDQYIRVSILTVVVIMATGLLNAQASVDTIKASVGQEIRLSVALFDGERTSTTKNSNIVVYTTNGENNTPRASYYPHDERLLVEVSLPKMLNGSNVDQLSQSELDDSLKVLDGWLSDRFQGRVPSVYTWCIRRIDYSTHWEVGEDMALYLDACECLDLPKYGKKIFDSGVKFESKTRHVLLYDKYKESGEGLAQGLLRYEVQNRKFDAVEYMAENWLNCGTDVASMVKAHHAHAILNRFAKSLHLDTATHVPLNDSILQEHFGRRWAQAKTYSEVIKQHGMESVARKMIGRGTYYRYKRELATIPRLDEYLEPLLIGAA